MASDLYRDRIRAWLDALLSQHRIEVPELAARAKVAPSTIYRWFDNAYPFEARTSTLRKIAEAFGTRVPSDDDDNSVNGFHDGELQQVFGADIPPALNADNNQGVWRIGTRALELAGYLPGDLVLVEIGLQPRAGDVVCCQVYNLERGSAETKLRLFRPPFVITRTMDPMAEEPPQFVDNERVAIAGTVVRSMRVRAA